jgi:uncharacterized protein YdiU (UPF0061 family)
VLRDVMTVIPTLMVAASPFWEFRTFFSQNDLKTLKSLADFSIKYHFPEKQLTKSYIQFFREVASKTREMVVH